MSAPNLLRSLEDFTGSSTSSLGSTAHHEHGNVGRLSHRRAHRPEPGAREAAPAPTSDHHQLSILRFTNQPASRLITDEPSLDVHIRIPLLPARQPFGEDLVALIFILRPVHSQHREDRDVAPRVQGNQAHAAERRLLEGHGRRCLRRGGAVYPEEDGSAGVHPSASGRMTATGQCAWWTRPVLTDPSSIRPSAPVPRLPTTTIL